MNNWDIGDRTLCDRAGEACNEHELCMVVVPRKSCCRPRRWRLLIWGRQSFPRWIEWCSERGSWDQTRRSPAEWSSPKDRSTTGTTWSVTRSHFNSHTAAATTCDVRCYTTVRRVQRCSQCARHRTTALDALTHDVGRHRTTRRHRTISLRCRTTSCGMWTPPLNQCVQLQRHRTTSYDIVRCRAQCKHRFLLVKCDKLTLSIALEHGVNLLQQWRHRTSLQSLSFEITLNTWTFIVAM